MTYQCISCGHLEGEKDYADCTTQTRDEALRATDAYSPRLNHEKYRQMQELLARIAGFDGEGDVRQALDGYSRESRAVIAGMRVPRGPSVRAEERANQLETLALAYRMAAGVYTEREAKDPLKQSARALTVEALKEYERARPPAPLDPLLLDRTS